MQQNISIQLRRRIVLRIPAKNLLFPPGRVRQVDKIANHIAEAQRIKQPLHHGVERVDPILLDQIAAVRLTPGIEELVRREKRARLIVHPIADHAKRIVFKQLRDVALVAHCQLDKGIVNRRLLTDRALEFKHHQRQPIDVENAIRNPLLVAVDLELIHHLKDVAAWVVDRRFLRHDRRHLARFGLPKSDQI